MTIDVNRVFMTGRLGQKPELKKSLGGNPYTRFQIANHHWRSSKAEERPPQWHSIVVWGPQAQVCVQYLDKGSLVLIEGELETRRFVNEQGKRIFTEVIARRVQFLNRPKRGKLQPEELRELNDLEEGLTEGAPQMPEEETSDISMH